MVTLSCLLSNLHATCDCSLAGAGGGQYEPGRRGEGLPDVHAGGRVGAGGGEEGGQGGLHQGREAEVVGQQVGQEGGVVAGRGAGQEGGPLDEGAGRSLVLHG